MESGSPRGDPFSISLPTCRETSLTWFLVGSLLAPGGYLDTDPDNFNEGGFRDATAPHRCPLRASDHRPCGGGGAVVCLPASPAERRHRSRRDLPSRGARVRGAPGREARG